VLVLLCGERERQRGAVSGRQFVRLTGQLSATDTIDLTIRIQRTLTDGVGAHPYSWTNGFGRLVFVFKGEMGLTIEIRVFYG
jgi:hypothetical protein